MKYAKKIKLVDIDDDGHHATTESSHLSLPTDRNFTAPRTLSILDN